MPRTRFFVLALSTALLLALATACVAETNAVGGDDLGTGSDDDGANPAKDVGFVDPDASSVVDTHLGSDPGAADVANTGGHEAGPDVAGPEGLILLDAVELEHFSFFVTSLASLVQLSGNSQGFGGDLTFGETGAGAGLRGADKICATIAELSQPGSSAKEWRAFLSAADDGSGAPVNAIDRIGEGPWYDRLGRLFANDKAELLYDRPQSAHAAIKNDFPNEWGVPNHQPDPTQPKVDNHDMLTGSNKLGKLYGATATCKDWTAATGNTTTEGKPRVGHSWPTTTGPGGGGGGETMAAPPGPGDDKDMANWMSALTEAGCKAGINLVENGAGDQSLKTVGAGGGYGGFYCFALVP
jgi:hypothetical protein